MTEAELLVSIFQKLIRTLGGNKLAVTQWLGVYNEAFNSKPIDCIRTYEGLVTVNNYLEAMTSSDYS